jgi:hypothetical protein
MDHNEAECEEVGWIQNAQIVSEMDSSEHNNEYFLLYKMFGISWSVEELTSSEGTCS